MTARTRVRPLVGITVALLLQGGCGTSPVGDSADARRYTRDVIEARVRQALLHELGIAGSAIGIQVDGAVVTLSGFVETQKERRRASSIVQGLDKVERVENRITVK